MVYLIGYMGSGKTTFGRLLAKKLKISFLDTDIEIEKKEKKSISEIFQENGESYFRKLENQLLKTLNNEKLIACGGGMPIHNNNMSLINKKGKSIYLKGSSNYLAEKLKNDQKRRPLIYDVEKRNLEKYIKKELEKREPLYNLAHYTILLDHKDQKTILREIHSLLLSF